MKIKVVGWARLFAGEARSMDLHAAERREFNSAFFVGYLQGFLAKTK